MLLRVVGRLFGSISREVVGFQRIAGSSVIDDHNVGENVDKMVRYAKIWKYSDNPGIDAVIKQNHRLPFHHHLQRDLVPQVHG